MGLVGLMLAAQVAHAGSVKKGTTYTKEGGAYTPSDSWATVVSMDLPARLDHISGRGTINNYDRSIADTVDCYVYVGSLVLVDRNTVSVPAGGFAALGFEGVAVIASGGAPVWVQGRSKASSGPSDPGPWTSARLGAVRVPAIVNAP